MLKTIRVYVPYTPLYNSVHHTLFENTFYVSADDVETALSYTLI